MGGIQAVKSGKIGLQQLFPQLLMTAVTGAATEELLPQKESHSIGMMPKDLLYLCTFVECRAAMLIMTYMTPCSSTVQNRCFPDGSGQKVWHMSSKAMRQVVRKYRQAGTDIPLTGRTYLPEFIGIQDSTTTISEVCCQDASWFSFPMREYPLMKKDCKMLMHDGESKGEGR